MVKAIFFSSLCCVLLICAGCSTLYNPATERNEFILINSATEVALGKSAIQELGKKHRLTSDQALQRRVERIGSRLAKVSDRQDIQYVFAVLEDKELNAMALPGGYIYVYQGLMEALNDDELAYVVGHEIGHVAARHIAKKLQANMAYQVLLGVAFAGMGDSTKARSQEIATGANLAYSILLELPFSRKDEYEADALGVRYSVRAGFDPYASLNALAKLKQGQGAGSKLLVYFRTHPYVDDRIQALNKIIPDVVAKNAKAYAQ
ncbi:MAG: M48 family metalloprotease [Candidatus Omnitrophica bacterium]|nr:M48 family metalloprotease [Candidatus Omnitrophota bacterium]